MSYAPALVAAACAGDETAIGALLAAAQPDIRRYARRSCRTTSDVEDAVQEVMLIMHRRMPTLQRIGSLSGWLFVVAQRLCWRLGSTLLPGVEFELLPRGTVEQASPADLRIDLARAVQSLPDYYRVVLLLRDVEELSVAEIAARLDATREAVKARLHRARKLVREYLA